MVVGKLMVLLWHHCTSDPYPTPCKLHDQWLEELYRDDLLTIDERGVNRSTQKAWAFIDRIRNTPMPTQVWSYKDILT